jgi:hypothetical protein
MPELAETLGADLDAIRLPEWLERWSDDVALPPTKAPAPSDWS